MVTGTYPGFVNLQNNTNGSQKRTSYMKKIFYKGIHELAFFIGRKL